MSEMTKRNAFVGEWMLLKILADLPPKTLIRFISKWWYDLINNPMFIAKHLSNSTNNISTSIFLKRLGNDQEPKTPQLFSLLTFPNYTNDDDDHSILSVVKEMDLPLAMRLRNVSVDSLRIKGHCAWIICLEDNHSDVFLWNPAIEECRQLSPEPYLRKWYKKEYFPEYRPGVDNYRPGHCFIQSMGFGYDPKSKDYKIIDIGLSRTPIFENNEVMVNIMYPPRAVVYSLASDSWREIETDSLETETTNLWPESFQMYYKGMCYWIGHEQDKEINSFDVLTRDHENIRDVIISFDISNEVFHDILLPDSLYAPSSVE